MEFLTFTVEHFDISINSLKLHAGLTISLMHGLIVFQLFLVYFFEGFSVSQATFISKNWTQEQSLSTKYGQLQNPCLNLFYLEKKCILN